MMNVIPDMTIQITAPHFCAGCVVVNMIATKCAPIIAYMTGWHVQRIMDYCQQKQWGVVLVGPPIDT